MYYLVNGVKSEIGMDGWSPLVIGLLIASLVLIVFLYYYELEICIVQLFNQEWKLSLVHPCATPIGFCLDIFLICKLL